MDTDHPALIAVLIDQATVEERAEVEAWRAALPANDALFRRRDRVWRQLGMLDGRRPTLPVALPRRRGRLHSWIGLSAAALAAIVVGSLAWDREDGVLLGAESVVTGVGEVTTLTLNDGTVVRLGPESRLAFRGLDGSRDVFLEGQAYFAVQSGGEGPFRVHTAGGGLTVLGTRFDVRARGSDVRVVVVQGRVEMDARGARVSVTRNQMGRIDDGGAPVVQAVDDVYEVTAWIGDFLAFESTPMSEVAAELQRRFGLQILIVDPRLEDDLVTGWFKDRSPEDMIASICWVVNARCTLSDGTVRMDRPRDFQRGLSPQMAGK